MNYLNVFIFSVNMWGVRGACTVVVRVLYAALSRYRRHTRKRERNERQPRWVSTTYTRTRTHTGTHTDVFTHTELSSTVQFSLSNSLSLIRSQPAYQQREPSPGPPSPSLSRHCCCEDEMSVLLKVPLKHNSDLWCLVVSFSVMWGSYGVLL